MIEARNLVKMMDYVGINVRKILTLLILTGLMIFTTPEINAAQKNGISSLTSKSKTTKKKRKSKRRHKRRRSYNPLATRSKAIEIIRRNSDVLCDLAGLVPLAGDSNYVFEDFEEGEDVEELVDDLDFAEEPLELDSSEINEESENNDEMLPADMETFRTLWLSYVDDGTEDEYTQGGIQKKSMMKTIMDWFGTPYRFGGNTRRAIDCSAFTRTIYNEVCEIELPRTAREQVQVGIKVRRNELEFGDLIFFHTYSYSYASHVGIYLGDGLFAHSSSRYGVTVSSLNSDYYSTHFIGASRLFLNEIDHFVDRTGISATD